MTWFSEIIHEEDQYEVSKAKAEIAFKCFIGAITARNLVVLIHRRFYHLDTTLSLNAIPEVK